MLLKTTCTCLPEKSTSSYLPFRSGCLLAIEWKASTISFLSSITMDYLTSLASYSHRSKVSYLSSAFLLCVIFGKSRAHYMTFLRVARSMQIPCLLVSVMAANKTLNFSSWRPLKMFLEQALKRFIYFSQSNWMTVAMRTYLQSSLSRASRSLIDGSFRMCRLFESQLAQT